MEQNPIKNDARRRRRVDGFGNARRTCICGENDWSALTPLPRSLLEEHHLVGKAMDAEATVLLCFNCHRKLTERMRANGTSSAPPSSCLDLIANIFLALAAFFAMLSEKLTEWAQRPANLALALDTNFPAWRELPEAQ